MFPYFLKRKNKFVEIIENVCRLAENEKINSSKSVRMFAGLQNEK